MQDDGCGCIEFWHEHPEAPRGSGPGRTPDGKPTHWLRFVDMVDRVACPMGDSEIYGDPHLLVRPDRGEQAS